MNNGIAQEELIAPELTLPVQFRDIWHGPGTSSPELMLAMSVLGQAATDLQRFRFAKRRGRQRLYIEAYQWIASNDRAWPYAFLNLCDALHLSPSRVRAQLLGDAPAASRAPALAAGDHGIALVFRLGRPANVKSMMIARAPVGRGRSRSGRAYSTRGAAA